MSYTLLAAGSNSGGQLAFGNFVDSHRLKSCLTSDGSSFPPSGSKIVQLSSGANHTMALVLKDYTKPECCEREIWVTGCGSQGQIGLSNIAREDDEEGLKFFIELDLEEDLGLQALIESFTGPEVKSELFEVEPIHVACGWNTSYIAFRMRQREGRYHGEEKNEDETIKQADSRASEASMIESAPPLEYDFDFLVSLGRSNEFGELGIGQPTSTSSSSTTSAFSIVHLVSLPQAFEIKSTEERYSATASIQSRKGPKIKALVAGPRHVLCLLSDDHLAASHAARQQALIGWGAARHGQIGPSPSPAPVPKLSTNATPGSRMRPGRSSPASIAWNPRVVSRWGAKLSLSASEGSRYDLCPIAAGRDHSAFLCDDSDGTSTSSNDPQALRFHSIGSDRLGQCSKFSSNSSQSRTFSSHSEEWIPTQVSCCWNTTSILCQRSLTAISASLGPSTCSSSLLSRNVGACLKQVIWSCGANGKGQWGSGENVESHFADLSAVIPADSCRTITSLVSGSEHSLILVKDSKTRASEVWGWGWSEHGNLAQDDERDRFTPVLIWSSSSDDHFIRSVEDIWAGCGTSFLQIQEGVNFKESKSIPKSPSKEQIEFCRRLPKIELHAHLNGSIRRSTLSELAKSEGLDPKQSEVVKGDARSLSEMFAVFDVIHQCVRGASTIRRISREMLEDLEADGVIYVEVRTTPRAHPEDDLTVEGYIEAVLDGFRDYETRKQHHASVVIPRLILSIDRRDGPDVSSRTVALAKNYMNKGVVGIDLSGDPTKGDWKDWEPSLRAARRDGLKITLHAGEVPDQEEEMLQMLDFKPDRFGHVCFISERCLSLLGKLQIPLELCLTSNVLSNSVQSYEQHHFLRHHSASSLSSGSETGPGKPLRGNIVCLSTDDSAVFGSPLSKEYAIAMAAFEMDESQMRELSERTLGAVFVDGEVKEEVRRKLFRAD